MLGISQDWEGGIEDFVEEANQRLAEVLPLDRASRPKDEVNARLVRHYTTEGLLPAPRREGREARYGRLHLLSLLALRRLMADGLSGKALISALTERSEEDLARLARNGNVGLEGILLSHAPPSNPALAYLSSLREQVSSPRPRALAPVAYASPQPVREETAGDRSRRRSASQSVVRVQVTRGLVVELSEAFRWPKSEQARLELLEALWASLVDARQASSAASGDDT
ncbi:MerR family transcriptional regulator (plasmid) [Deinococcus psychrotolerans]|uniref:MerR family transcriptional regulator n=1 Tax=Deinococcus psychrotolerans TaxID=2489213 RepID=A0A3G8YRL0_9DEIO|nr:MerR family transcriptional regulator [Deinococcus psychrotolerans]AZI45174.1 MerR family transcriptional regulator [Deinococcus psychrotolerans]